MDKIEKISNENGEWYMVEIIEKCEPVIHDENQELRRVTTWGNYHLIKGKTPEEAYNKAVKIGKEGEYKYKSVGGKDLQWIFVGIGNFLPIYEDIEDGGELMWTDYGDISNKKTYRLITEKKEIMVNLKPKKKLG